MKTGTWMMLTSSAYFENIILPGWIVINLATRQEYVVLSRVGTKDTITTALASGKIALDLPDLPDLPGLAQPVLRLPALPAQPD
jgi:hypothetical protein